MVDNFPPTCFRLVGNIYPLHEFLLIFQYKKQRIVSGKNIQFDPANPNSCLCKTVWTSGTRDVVVPCHIEKVKVEYFLSFEYKEICFCYFFNEL
jgi:hypothetical protein